MQLVETPFLAAVEKTLNERYTPQMEVIYKILIGKQEKFENIWNFSRAFNNRKYYTKVIVRQNMQHAKVKEYTQTILQG